MTKIQKEAVGSYFNEEKTALLTSIATGTTTRLALEISKVNSGSEMTNCTTLLLPSVTNFA